MDALNLEHMMSHGKRNPLDYVTHIRSHYGALRSGLWGVTQKEWPYKKFPPYGPGALYIASARVIHCAVPLIGDKKQRLTHMEDVSFGILLAPCGQHFRDAKEKIKVGAYDYPTPPEDSDAPFRDYSSKSITSRIIVTVTNKMKGWHDAMMVTAHFGYWGGPHDTKEEIMAAHFVEMNKIFGSRDLVMRWFWYVPFATSWKYNGKLNVGVEPLVDLHTIWGARGTPMSVAIIYKTYVAFWNKWWDDCVDESCVAKPPHPASDAAFKNYLAALPTCFAMTSDRSEVIIADSQVCVDALVTWKAKDSDVGEEWHSLGLVKRPISISQDLW